MASKKSGPSGRGSNETSYTTLAMQGIPPHVIAAVRLFQGYAMHRPEEQLHEEALQQSELLISVAEHPEAARELSLILKVPEMQLREYARGILDLLIFNKDNNPHMSLGLTEQATRTEISRRWKRLVVLNHPDRYRDKKIHEDRTKKINEAYENILTMKSRPVQDSFSEVFRTVQPARRYQGAHTFKYLRHLPVLILSIAIIIAIISILLLIRKVSNHSPAGSTGKTEKVTVTGYILQRGSETAAVSKYSTAHGTTEEAAKRNSSS